MKDNIIKFDYYFGDIKTSSVEANLETGEVKSTDFVDNSIITFFGKGPKTLERLDRRLSQRIFPKNQAESQQLVERLGLKEYNVLELCKITKGKMAKDAFWIDFK